MMYVGMLDTSYRTDLYHRESNPYRDMVLPILRYGFFVVSNLLEKISNNFLIKN